MKGSFFLICGFLLFSSAAAQPATKDSLYFYEQSRTMLKAVQQNATQLVSSVLKQAGTATLDMTRESGSFRLPYEAQSNTSIRLYTEGFQTIGRFKLAGQFYFDKVWEDSLAWNLQGMHNPARPYYFFAGKAGQFERQNYNLNTIISYEVLKNKLYLSAGAQYRYHWSTGSVDPRPDIKSFNIKLLPELTYRIGQHHLGASLLWGSGSETQNISFKNDNYGSSQLYPERILFMSLGFGHYGKMGRILRSYDRHGGFGFHYAGKIGNWTTKADYAYRLAEQNFTRTQGESKKNYEKMALLQSEFSDVQLLLQKKGTHINQQITVNVNTSSSRNWSAEFQATSYQYLATEAALSYMVLFMGNKKVQPEAAAGIKMGDIYKEDGVAAHRYQHQYIHPWLKGTAYWQLPHSASFSASFKPSFRFPIKNELDVPASQETYFTKGLVYPEYSYTNAHVAQLDIKLHFVSKNILKRAATGFSLSAGWQAPINSQKELSTSGVWIPTGNRFYGAIGAHLYL